jgi:hypothetical protein
MHKILFSITVHENIECLEEQLKNIFHYNDNCAVLVHISKQFKLSNDDIEKLHTLKSQYALFINPTSIETVYCKILTAQIVNILYAKNIEYEYFCMHASNELYFKKGAYDYMKQFDVGLYYIPSDTNLLSQYHHRDIVAFAKFLNKPMQTYTGQHEGSFFKKHIIENVAEIILRFCPLENLNFLNDTTEETMTPTALFNIYSNLSIGYPITFIRNRADHITGNDNENNIVKTVQFIETMREKSEYNSRYVMQEPIVSIFVIKGILRNNYNDQLRQYLRKLS